MDELGTTVFKASRSSANFETVVVGLLSLFMLYLFVDVIRHPAPKSPGGLIFIAGYFFVMFFGLFLQRRRESKLIVHDLVLSWRGLHYEPLRKEFGVPFVPWKAISDSKVLRIGKHSWIRLKLSNPQFSENLRFSRGHKLIVGESITFMTINLEGGGWGNEDRIDSEIDKYIAKFSPNAVGRVKQSARSKQHEDQREPRA